MALVGTRVDVAQQGDGTTIGVRTDVVVDQRTGLVAEKKTIVAEVPIEGGGTALIAGEQIRAVGLTEPPPSYGQITHGQGAPPSYEQIFGMGQMRNEMKEARNTSSNQGTFAVKFCKILCGSAACLICLLILAALPVTMIVIGAVYFNDCPGIENLRNWLIVFGSFSLFQTVMNIVRRCLFRKKDSDDENSDKGYGSYCCGGLEGLITIFLFVWIIVGSVWVFRHYATWRTEEMCRDPNINPKPDCYCHPVPYLFSFITLIVIYSISGLFCLCCCCCFCCAALFAGD